MPGCYVRNPTSENFGCGRGVAYSSDLTVDLTTFGHNPANAGQAILGFNHRFVYAYEKVSWANPNLWLKACVGYWSSIETQSIKSENHTQRWRGCRDYFPHGTSGSFTGTISAADTKVHVRGGESNNVNTPFSFYGVDYCGFDIQLPNTHRITPPRNLSGTIDNFTINNVNIRATLQSWSDNPNIRGVPYTSGGGANWNWYFSISKDGVVIQERYYPGQNELVKTHSFSGLNLLENTTYTIRYVALNEFQQRVEATRNFTIPKRPSAVTVTTLDEKPKNIHGQAYCSNFGTSTARWEFNLKNMDGSIIKTTNVNNGNPNTVTSILNGFNLKLGKDYVLEAKCINTAGLFSIGSKTIRMYLGWLVPPTGPAKKIRAGQIIATSNSKNIVGINKIQ